MRGEPSSVSSKALLDALYAADAIHLELEPREALGFSFVLASQWPDVGASAFDQRS